MCFSAEASFTATAALLPVGAYCVGAALRKDRRLLPLALIPVAFGVQQAAEGCVWLGLHHDDGVLVQGGAAVFLFFALAFWPFWIPFSLVVPEERRTQRVILATAVVLSVVWLVLYAPVALDPARWARADVVNHSIAYDTENLPGFQFVPRAVWRTAYLAFICGPLLLAKRNGGGGTRLRVLGGAAVAGLFAVCYLVYWYAFTSVWCFFAAVLSLMLAALFAKLPARNAPVQRSAPGRAVTTT
jgi:hypothetical protein